MMERLGRVWLGGMDCRILTQVVLCYWAYCMWIVHNKHQVCLVPEQPRPKINDLLCGCIIRSTAVYLGHLGEERNKAVWVGSGGGGRLPDRPCKSKQIVRVNWERQAETPVHEIFNCHLWRNCGLLNQQTASGRREVLQLQWLQNQKLRCGRNLVRPCKRTFGWP